MSGPMDEITRIAAETRAAMFAAPPAPHLPIVSPSQALRATAPCLVQVAPGSYFIHDEERPDRLYAEAGLPSPRRF